MMKKFFSWLLVLSLLTNISFAQEYGGGSEEIFILDEDDDSSGDIVIQFGSALNETISWDSANNQFSFSDDIEVDGTINALTYCDENGGNCFTAAGATTDNDNQTLGLAGSVVSISGGNNIDLSSLDTNTTYSAGTGLNLAGTVFSSLLGTDINSAEIVDGTVSTVDLANNAVNSAKIVDSSITSADVLDGTIALVDLANNSVNTTKIVDGSVTAADLAANSVGSSEIIDGTVAALDLANDAVNSAKIVDATITGDDLASNSVDSDEIVTGAVTTTEILDGTIASTDLADDAVTTGKIGTGGAADADKILTTDASGNPQWELKSTIENELAENSLDNGAWTVSNGSVGPFSANGSATENVREWGTTPFNSRGLLWKAVPDSASGADGGWNYSNIPVEHTKSYRSMAWIKKTGSTDGTTYFGAGQGTSTANLNGTANGNPYFWSGDLPELDKWYLLVGYIHGSDDVVTTSLGGIYDGETGEKVISITDFRNSTAATTQGHRAYLYYNTDTANRQYFWGARFEEVSGSESPVESFLPVSAGSGGKFEDGTNVNHAVYTAGNVGIGTIAPSANLEIEGSNSATLLIDARNDGGSPATSTSIKLDGYDDRAKGIFMTDEGSNYEWFAGEGYNYAGYGIGVDTDASSQSEYATNAKLFINVDGDVGIGTSSPDVELDVNTGKINASEICDEDNQNCIDLSVGSGQSFNIEDWQTPTFQDSWANYGNGYSTAGYYKDALGTVHLKGLVRSGTMGTAACIFTVPTEYRPAERVLYDTISSGNGVSRVDVTAAGCVVPVAGTNPWFSLEGLTFLAASGGVFSGDSNPWAIDGQDINFTSGDVAIGTATLSGALRLDVEGAIGATDYCDENGANCFQATSVEANTDNQSLTFTGTNLSISGGNSVNLSSLDTNTTYTAGTGMTLSGTAFSSTLGTTITSNEIVDGTVALADIANNAINSAKVADNTLTASDLASNSVGSAELANNAVNSAKVLDNTLTAADLANNSVGSGELANNAVNSAKVADNTLTAADLASNSVDSDEIAADAVTTAEIGTGGAADANKVLVTDGSGNPQWEVKSNFASASLTSGQVFIGNASNIATGVIITGDATLSNTGNFQLAANSVTAAEIATGAVASAELLDGSVGTVDFADNAVTIAKIGTGGGGDADKVLTTDASGNPQWELRSALVAAASNNDLDTDVWDIGTGSIGNFSQNGLASENIREWGQTPFQSRGILWKATPSGDSSGDGGWNHANIPVEPNKAYRLMVWIKKTGDTVGTTYLGAGGGGTATYNLNDTPNTNPYFWYGDLPEFDKWYLVVGYLHANNDPDTNSYGGIYDGETGEKVISITDFKNGPTATTQTHRAYLFYNTNTTNRQYFWGPRYEEVSGKELPIEAFLPSSLGGGSADINQLEATINNNIEEVFTHGSDPDLERIVDVYYQDAETVTDTSFWDVFTAEEGLYTQENVSATEFTNDTLQLEPAGAFVPGTTNLSLGATAIGSDATRPYANGNDNDTATFWYNQGGGPSAGQWWGVDLGAPTTVMRAQMNWYSTTYHATSMNIEGSNDGTNWTTVSSVTPAGGNTTDETWDFAPATYRYWRFYCVTGNNATYFVLREGRFFEAIGSGFSTTPAYVTTGAAKSFNTTAWSQINGVTLDSVEPAGTSLKYLFSFDDRSTWRSFVGGVWAAQTLTNIENVGMTKAQVEALTTANWSATNGVNSATNDLDYAVSLETSSTTATPILSGVNVEYGTQTFWQKATDSKARVRLLSDTETSVQNLTGQSTTFKVNILAP